jgi:hypothetical protein
MQLAIVPVEQKMTGTGGFEMNDVNGIGKRIRAGLTVAALVLFACVPTKDEHRTAGSGTELGNVIGRIYTADNAPARGIEVVLYPNDGDTSRILKSRTDDEGAFAFRSVAGAYRLISLDGNGNGVTVDSIQPVGEAKVDLARRNLSPLGGLSAYVSVKNPQEYKVELTLRGTPFRKNAEANAGFDWQGIPAGRYWLSVYYAGSKSRELPVIIESGKTTTLPDSIVMDFQYSFGISARDTVILSTSQLPYTFGDKVFAKDEDVVSIYWALNGKIISPTENRFRMPMCEVTREDLRDTGLNLLELRILLKDTAVARYWYISLDDKRVAPWPHQAVRAILVSTEANPRPDNEYQILGRFRILDRAILRREEMAFWGWQPVAGADSLLPAEINVPVPRRLPNYNGCGYSPDKKPPIAEFPGDTVTFFLEPDTVTGGRVFRIRSNERLGDLRNMAFFARAAWPLADMYSFRDRSEFFDLSIRNKELGFLHLGEGRLPGDTYACLKIYRRYSIDSTGALRESIAVPAGFDSKSVLLHYRDGLPDGLLPESLPLKGRYVFISDSGKGLTVSDTARREFQLDGRDLADLRTLLEGLPAAIPLEWEKDHLGFSHPDSAAAVRFLFSGNRGTVLFKGSESADPDKASFIGTVETWLRSKRLL